MIQANHLQDPEAKDCLLNLQNKKNSQLQFNAVTNDVKATYIPVNMMMNTMEEVQTGLPVR